MSAGATPDVTVIMAAYNAYPHIQRAIDSVLAQTIGLENIEIIVVDDGSTDATGAYLDEVAARCPCMTVVHQVNSGGPAGPRNRALDLLRGRFIFFLDADDELSPDALAAMVTVADANGTDVVLARMKGVGGRSAPKSMFRRSAARTTLFESNAYGTLNPMKLFRADLIRRLDLRFPTNLPWGEDQPFVAEAYFAADGISILADKDYVFWSFLDDGSNITTTAVSLQDRMPVADRMFDFVAERVEPGEARDRLMARHFRVELFGSAFLGFRAEPNEELRRSAFGRFRELVDRYYTEGVEQRLWARARIAFRLVAEDRYEDFGAFLNLLGDELPRIALEGDRVFEHARWFRESDRGIPEELYDVTGLCRTRCEIIDVQVSDVGYEVTVACSVDLVEDAIESARIVFANRADETREVTWPQSCERVRSDSPEVTAFTVTLSLDPDALMRMERGTWDAWCVVEIGAFRGRCRLYSGPEPSRLGGFLATRRVGEASGRMTDVAPYATQAGNFTVKVRHEIAGTLGFRRAGLGLIAAGVELRSARGDAFAAGTRATMDEEDGDEVPAAVTAESGVLRLDMRRIGYGAYRVHAAESGDCACAPVDFGQGGRGLARCRDGYAVVSARGKRVSVVSPRRWLVGALRKSTVGGA